mmetsp:Transcript_13205/g.14862  ORF Transcript_13205/g.14862 Transcript_13205/m.14862 type:complete len:374 (-) Transcript_13205:185-1306(-)
MNICDEISVAYALTNLCSNKHNNQINNLQMNNNLQNNLQMLPGRPTNINQHSNHNMMSLPLMQTLLPLPSKVVINKNPDPKKNFPQKLFDVLSCGFHDDILRWLPDGATFVVQDKRRFVNEILPRYFKDGQYTSFTRKLSRWKFTRMSRGPYMGAYYHKLFRRDHRSLCSFMSCNNDNTIKVDIKSDAAVARLLLSPALTSESTRRVGPKSSVPCSMNSNLLSQQEDALKMQQTDQNIIQIKERLSLLRLEKAKLQQQKQMVFVRAEAERLHRLQRLRYAVNESLSRTKARMMLFNHAAGSLVSHDAVHAQNSRSTMIPTSVSNQSVTFAAQQPTRNESLVIRQNQSTSVAQQILRSDANAPHTDESHRAFAA